MRIKNRFSVLSFVLVFILILSAVLATPAYADEAPPESAPVETQVEETNPPADTEEEATPPTSGETDSAPSEESILDEEQPILEQLPENTEIIVLDEEGEALPLVTEEAQQAISSNNNDPMWCPAGKTPIANVGGCSDAFTTFSDLLVWLQANDPGMAGTIWIHKDYKSSTATGTVNDTGVTNFTLNGGATFLDNMANFALTIQGGWSGTGKTIVADDSSEFLGASLHIINWNAPVTINNITISGATGTNALHVQTTGNIVLNKVKVENNTSTQNGALLSNSAGTGSVTVTSSTFNSNSGTNTGLRIGSTGTITVKDITVSDNLNSGGAYLNNITSTKNAKIIISGTNTFSNNGGIGLEILSNGTITANNVIANDNTSYGAFLASNFVLPSVPLAVTFTGTNVFGDNGNGGLSITTFGPVTLNNIFANSNTGMGVSITNTGGDTVQAVKITGTNEFKYNTVFGLAITSKGIVTLNNINANSNGQTGVSINNSGPATSSVNITGTNTFNLNGNSGLVIEYSVSGGAVTLSNITANGNGTSLSGYGISIINHVGTTFKGVTLTGTNSFAGNYDNGINIITSGPITLNNITQSGTISGRGVALNNAPSGATKPQAVIINGLNNTFNNNNADGLYINTYGAVTLNNITANNNGLGMSFGTGLYITNFGSDKPQNVTIKGNNSFNNNYESGLYIISKGAVLTNSITADNNDGYGVLIVNNSGTNNVTMTGNNSFTNNASDNLYIYSAGVISLNNLTSNSSSNGMGANISNVSSATAKNVTLTGTNTFIANNHAGLLIQSKGIITTNNLKAINNGFGNNDLGVLLYNSPSPTNAGVNVNGTNIFNDNADEGLVIISNGNVKVNNITANSNGGTGLNIIGTSSSNTGSATLTGNNTFIGNGVGMVIDVYGAVTLNNIFANSNTSGGGVYIVNIYGGNTAPKPVILNGKNTFSNNTNDGLSITTFGAITLSNVTASFNGFSGAYIVNSGTLTPAPVTLNGTNLFDDNGIDNLNITSNGLIKINNITSTNAGNMGASLVNSTGTAAVTVSGTNYFDSNFNAGLYIQSSGAITLSNITSNNSTNDFGAQIWNTASGFATPKNIIMTGTNTFNNNSDTGLEIRTYGSVTINNLTANYNGLTGMNPTHGEGADIVNYFGDNTIIANVTLTGNNMFNGNYTRGLSIISFGTVKLNNITASENDVYGAFIDNSFASSNVYGVTLTGNNTFYDNGNDGLQINTKGAVSLNNLNVTFNGSNGMYINNTYAGATTPKPVTITGINNFSDNVGGFYIDSYGVVTLSKVTASSNTSGDGGYIVNNLANTPANVIITGYGIFNNNTSGSGLRIFSKGAVTLTNITAIGNAATGLFVHNTDGTGSVTLTGVNTFTNNSDNGAQINSNGAVSITKITADDNAQNGLVINTTGIVTLTCGSLNLNGQYGWQVLNAPSVIMKGVFTAGNGSGDFTSSVIPTFSRACPLP